MRMRAPALLYVGRKADLVGIVLTMVVTVGILFDP
jgi:hypothetical protein